MKQFTIDLGGICGIHGGIIYIYYLARILSENGMPCKVKSRAFPHKWFDPTYDNYNTDKLEGVVIAPEVLFNNSETVPLIQNPFIPCDLSKCKVAIGISPYICGHKYVDNLKLFYIPVFIFWDKCKDTKNKIPGSLVTSRVTSGKSFIPLPNIKAQLIKTDTHQQFIDGLKEAESYVHPVTKAGLEGPLLEAMATGCVVFYSDTRGSTGHIREGITGYQIDSEAEFITKYNVRDLSVGIRAREFMYNYYSDIACAKEICSVFSKVYDIMAGVK